ncbi:hypothetical protein EON64_20330, partial [archaeon]
MSKGWNHEIHATSPPFVSPAEHPAFEILAQGTSKGAEARTIGNWFPDCRHIASLLTDPLAPFRHISRKEDRPLGFQITMSNPQWAGEAELQGALQELCGIHPVPSNKIRQAVTVANKYSGEFKMVVYEIERFVKKAAVEDKVAGVFVMDSLCRQHSKERETFAKRFAIRLKDTASFLLKLSAKDRGTFLRLLEEWHKREVFPSSSLQGVAALFGVTLSETLQDTASAQGEAAAETAEQCEQAGRKRALEGSSSNSRP